MPFFLAYYFQSIYQSEFISVILYLYLYFLIAKNRIKKEIMIPFILFVLILLSYQLEDQMDSVKFLFLFVLNYS